MGQRNEVERCNHLRSERVRRRHEMREDFVQEITHICNEYITWQGVDGQIIVDGSHQLVGDDDSGSGWRIHSQQWGLGGSSDGCATLELRGQKVKVRWEKSDHGLVDMYLAKFLNDAESGLIQSGTRLEAIHFCMISLCRRSI